MATPDPAPKHKRLARDPARAKSTASSQPADARSRAGTAGKATLTDGLAANPEQALHDAIGNAGYYITEIDEALASSDMLRADIAAVELRASIRTLRAALEHAPAQLVRDLSAYVHDLVATAEQACARVTARTPPPESAPAAAAAPNHGVCTPIASVADAEARLERAVTANDHSGELIPPVAQWLAQLNRSDNMRTRLESAAMETTALGILGFLAGDLGILVSQQRSGTPFKGLARSVLRQFQANRSLLRVLAGEAPVSELELASDVDSAYKATPAVILTGTVAITAAIAAVPVIVSEATLIGGMVRAAGWRVLTFLLEDAVRTVALGEIAVDTLVTIGMAGGLAAYAKAVATDPQATLGLIVRMINTRGALVASGPVVEANPKSITMRTSAKAPPEAEPTATPPGTKQPADPKAAPTTKPNSGAKPNAKPPLEPESDTTPQTGAKPKTDPTSATAKPTAKPNAPSAKGNANAKPKSGTKAATTKSKATGAKGNASAKAQSTKANAKPKAGTKAAKSNAKSKAASKPKNRKPNAKSNAKPKSVTTSAKRNAKGKSRSKAKTNVETSAQAVARGRPLTKIPELLKLWKQAIASERPPKPGQARNTDPRDIYDKTLDRFLRLLVANTPDGAAGRKVLIDAGYKFLTRVDGRLKANMPLRDNPGLEKYMEGYMHVFRMSFQHLKKIVDGGHPTKPSNLSVMTHSDNDQLDKRPTAERNRHVKNMRGK